MFKVTITGKMLNVIPEVFPGAHQTVRWRRKPLWMPTAKSKLFRIPVKPKIPVEESDELKRLFNNYRTAIKSIRNFLYEKYSVQLQAKADTEMLKRAFEEDLARCNEINNRWSEERMKAREERVAKELAVDIEFARNRMENLLKEKELQLAHADQIVRKEKELESTFITQENIDEVIERAIENPTEYNFAIDLEGNQIVGRETQPNKKVEVK